MLSAFSLLHLSVFSCPLHFDIIQHVIAGDEPAKKGAHMHFTKMEGLGNDYIYVNLQKETVEDPVLLAKRISDRHFGVGSDGLVLIGSSRIADLRMIMYNMDGSRGKMCGNAARCIGKYAYEMGLTNKTEISLETDSGIKHLKLQVKNNQVEMINVDMGCPEFTPSNIPCTFDGNWNQTIKAGDHVFMANVLSMGNPHAVIFLDTPVESFDVALYGAAIERSPEFPEGVNVEFVNVLSETSVRMRVWERGSGITLACGTGACATAVAAIHHGFCKREMSVELDGGSLAIEWKSDGHVWMQGPARFICEGEYEL